MTVTLRIFIQFLRRDFYVLSSRLKDHIINCTLIEPALYIISLGYVLPRATFNNFSQSASTMFVLSGIVLAFTVAATDFFVETLVDLEGERTIDHDRSLLPDRLVVLRLITFNSFCLFLFLAPFIPVAKLLLGNYLVTTNLNFLYLFIALVLSSILVTTFNMASMLYIKSLSSLTDMWVRLYRPLLFFGGHIIPRHVVVKFSPLLGKLTLLNPLVYVSEIFGAAVVGSPDYLPFNACVGGLVSYSLIFTALACKFFKQKVDHI